MRDGAAFAAIMVGMGLSLGMFVPELVGCAGDSAQHAENVQTAATYEGEQILCVDRAKTIEESHACRCGVMQRYGRKCPPGWATDGGAP